MTSAFDTVRVVVTSSRSAKAGAVAKAEAGSEAATILKKWGSTPFVGKISPLNQSDSP
jgi:hypothetical protein